ncbi:class I tRNA ligase family protein [Rahnella perminowiae]|uniref:class I tRNA ligase family protein n=1 Tax=Rahnella perminowiae TaxID=2816244 RepID=UPI00215B8907|nr:class I tRNA ligase family protein [Rahnella perminowiae]MCR9003620.1 class I tRNA ligase family protein [Rahnella perminowiae]MCX2944055.1 class I tRNA ligase family protein [Rahnella perminowiae]
MSHIEIINLTQEKYLSRAVLDKGIYRINPVPEASDISIRILKLTPGSSTERHNHTEVEFWTVISGSVRVCLNGEDLILQAGDSIRVEPLCRHRIEALDENAVMQTVWWHHREIFEQSSEQGALRSQGFQRPLLIVPAMLTPNGGMHLGHAAGPFMVADVLTRAARMSGRKTFLVQGTHGHLEHIQIAAAKAGTDYYSLAETNTRRLKQSLQLLNVEQDIFLETRPTQRSTAILYEVLEKLMSAGLIVERTYDVPYDPSTRQFCVDAFVHGDCPHCGGESSGTECEGCGALVLDAELIRPVNLQGVSLERRPLTRLFLRLDALKNELERFAASASLPAFAKLFIEGWLKRGLPEVCLTNPNSAGVPVQMAGLDNLRFTVPMEYVPRHLLAIEQMYALQGENRLWHAIAGDELPELAILFGVDNAFGRLLVIPAVLAALGMPEFMPMYVIPNHMMLLEGQKFSTSRNHAIWVDEYVTPENAQALRFYLCRNRTHRKEADFHRQEFERFNAEFWNGQLPVMLEAADRLFEPFSDSKNLPGPGQWCADCHSFFEVTSLFMASIEQCYSLSMPNLRKITRSVETFVDEMTTFCLDAALQQKPVFMNSALNRTRARVIARALIALATALRPITPGFSEEIYHRFDIQHPSFTTLSVDWMAVELKNPVGKD